RSQNRPGFRHIEASVAGEPGQHGLDERKRRSLAAGGNVTHRPILGWAGTLGASAGRDKEREFAGHFVPVRRHHLLLTVRQLEPWPRNERKAGQTCWRGSGGPGFTPSNTRGPFSIRCGISFVPLG